MIARLAVQISMWLQQLLDTRNSDGLKALHSSSFLPAWHLTACLRCCCPDCHPDIGSVAGGKRIFGHYPATPTQFFQVAPKLTVLTLIFDPLREGRLRAPKGYNDKLGVLTPGTVPPGDPP